MNGCDSKAKEAGYTALPVENYRENGSEDNSSLDAAAKRQKERATAKE
jgi:hypothetical protein